MTKQEVLERMCSMASNVGSVVFNDECAHDCFCTEVHSDPKNFRFEEIVMKFIEEAVNKAIAERV